MSINKHDFFISYNKADSDWAQWIAWQLEEKGYVVFLQEWDIRPGDNFMEKMDQACQDFKKTLAILSPDYLKAKYAAVEWLARLREDPLGKNRGLIPIKVRDCDVKGLLGSIVYIDLAGYAESDAAAKLFDGLLPRGEPITRPKYPSMVRVTSDRPSFPGTDQPKPSEPKPPDLTQMPRMLVPWKDYVGRKLLLRELMELFEQQEHSVVSIWGTAGVGKSALVGELLEHLKKLHFKDIERVFAWSFYNQATRIPVTSSSEFFAAALEYFNHGLMVMGDYEKNARDLADLLQNHKCLLILDGIEPLQNSQDGLDYGTIKDGGIRLLLLNIMYQGLKNGGLIVLTSREPVVDLNPWLQDSYYEIKLNPLSKKESLTLLKNLRVEKNEANLEKISQECGGNPLALALFARACKVGASVDRHDIWEHIKTAGEGKIIQKVMGWYDKHYWASKKAPERIVLRLLGLFGRNRMDERERNVLVNTNIAKSLSNLSPYDWDNVYSRLNDSGLALSEAPWCSISASHPMVRQYFAEKLKNESLDDWHEAHSALFDYFILDQRKSLPDTLEEMRPLLRAIHHGCQAGRYPEALEVYRNRITNGWLDGYITNKLGAFDEDLSVLSRFFPDGWNKAPGDGLDKIDWAWLLSRIAFCLETLGELPESRRVRTKANGMYLELEDYSGAAFGAEELSMLWLRAGELEEAEKEAKKAIDLADKAFERTHDSDTTYMGTIERRIRSRVHLGIVLHMKGMLTKAHELFIEAENLHKQHRTGLKYLFRVQGLRFCFLLLDMAKKPENYKAILERAENIKELSEQSEDTWIMPAAYYYLIMGRALAGLGKVEEAMQQFNMAVADTGRVEDVEFRCLSLLTRAKLLQNQGEIDEAQVDSRRASKIASICKLQLLEADTHLINAHLLLDKKTARDDPQLYFEATDEFKKAKEIIETKKYGLRDAEQLLLEARINYRNRLISAAERQLEEASQIIENSKHWGLSHRYEVVKKEIETIHAQ